MKALIQRATAVWAVALLSGCGGGAARPAAPPPPSLGPVPVIQTVEQITRPIDEYLPRPQEVRTLIAAANVLNAKCMAGFGLRGSDTHATNIDDHGARVATAHTHLYGFFDPAIVATEGYDLVQLQSSYDPAEPRPVPISAAAKTVEIGSDQAGHPMTAYAGKPVPAGGCKAEAAKGTGGDLPDMNAAGLPDGGPPIPFGDPRVIDATAKWSTCMAAKGYRFSSPYDAMTSQVAQAPVVGSGSAQKVVHSPAEIAQATADLTCKQATDFMGTVIAVQTAYDRQYIAGHSAALAQYRRQLDDRVRAAARIVAASGMPPSV